MLGRTIDVGVDDAENGSIGRVVRGDQREVRIPCEAMMISDEQDGSIK